MKRTVLRITLWTVTLLTVALLSSAVGFAGESGNILSRGQLIEGNDVFSFADNGTRNSLKAAAEDFPSALDLSDGHVSGIKNTRDIITPVKFQNPLGTCWAFAATAAAEGSIIGEKKENGEDIDVRDSMYDFSEKHLAWFTNCEITDPEDSQYGEGIHWAEGMTSGEKLCRGGCSFFATQQYSSGIGPVLEKDYPYIGKNGLIEKVKQGNRIINYCYSMYDDWSIEDSERYYQKYQLDESFILPSPAGTDSNGEYEYDESAVNAIRYQLLKNRPVQVSFCADYSNPDKKGEGKYLNYNTWAHYTYETAEADHVVTIVGYDDNYSKENFNSGNRPPHDGAFLVKNSWGSGEESFPNRGVGGWGIEVNGVHTGYFWISYYDRTLEDPEAFDFNTAGFEEYYADEYDFMPVGEPCEFSFDDEDDVKMANVFTAESSMKLTAVSCQTGVPGTDVTYSIYMLSEDPEGPCDGICVYEGSETYEYGGFHKFYLENGPYVKKGQKYSVVVSQRDPNGRCVVYFNASEGREIAEENNICYWAEAVVNEGESYLSSCGCWGDLVDEMEVLNEMNPGYAVDNFPIKSYGDESKQTYLELSNRSVTVNPGEKVSETVSFHGFGDDEDIGELVWKSSDENAAAVKVSSSGTSAVITAVAPGVSYISVTEKTFGTAIAKITVLPATVKKTVSVKNRTLKVKWKRAAGADGYDIKYRRAGGKWKNVRMGKNDTLLKIRNLKKGKYSVKMRAFAMLESGKLIYGAYDKTDTVKVK